MASWSVWLRGWSWSGLKGLWGSHIALFYVAMVMSCFYPNALSTHSVATWQLILSLSLLPHPSGPLQYFCPLFWTNILLGDSVRSSYLFGCEELLILCSNLSCKQTPRAMGKCSHGTFWPMPLRVPPGAERACDGHCTHSLCSVLWP